LNYFQAGLDFSTHNKDRYHRVISEGLISNPEETLIHLMRSLGEEFEKTQLNLSDTTNHIGIEDPKTNKTNQIYNQSHGKWQKILSTSEAKFISP